jgi:predicted DNA binding CopG/RHH family protein
MSQKKKKWDFDTLKLDEEEQALSDSVERGEWVSVGILEERKAMWEQIARNTLDNKRKRISIAIRETDLAQLKAKALEEGIPYQTLINSILHKYVTGQFSR